MVDFAEGISNDRAGRRLGRALSVEWLQENELATDEAAEAFYARNPDPELP